jgi:hypothetical protein
VETRFEKERGWNPLGITKQGEGEPQITLESPLVASGRRRKKKRVECGLKNGSKWFYTQTTGLVQWDTRPDLSD